MSSDEEGPPRVMDDALNADPPSRKRVKAMPTAHEAEEAAGLEVSLFGDAGAMDGFGHEQDEAVSIADLVRSAAVPRGASRKAASVAAAAASARAELKPVWHDAEDDEVEVAVAKGKSRNRKLRKTEKESVLQGAEYVDRLREQHQKLNPRTQWAELPSERIARKRAERTANGGRGDSESEEEELLSEEEGDGALEAMGRSTGALTKGVAVGGKLPPGELRVTRLGDANKMEPSHAVVRSVQFHPNGQMLLTAGLDKSLRLFQIDGGRNPKVQTVFLEDLPIHKAAFSADGAQVIAAGRRRHFYVYDLVGGQVERVAGIVGRDERSCEGFAASRAAGGPPLLAFYGNEGHIPLVSLKTRQAVGSLKMNGSVRTAAFSADGNQLLSSGSDGVVYVWDLRTQRCLSRAVDEGCLHASSLATSADGRYVATGADSGVVNLYGYDALLKPSTSKFLPSTPKPLKTLMNLTTTIDTLCFNADSQMLAMSSRMKKDALRLVHLPTGTVFANWPTSRTPLHCVTAMDFSPGGGYFAMGNAKGKALLYRIHHYGRA